LILCHEFKFIFLKTSKTAGTSVEIALSRFCGPNDIITPISVPDEQIRSQLEYRGPQNYQGPLHQESLPGWLKWILQGGRKNKFFNHIPARKMKPLVEPEIWDSYFKFCIARNPWDRFLSQYYFRCRSEPRPTVAGFLASKDPALLMRDGYNLYTINDRVAVDKICKFEALDEDLEMVRQQLGLPEKLELPQAKSGFRGDKGSYREILSEREREQIAGLFRKEIELLGYTF
jgi:hypothetical protein